jgi:hypothetical protein
MELSGILASVGMATTRVLGLGLGIWITIAAVTAVAVGLLALWQRRATALPVHDQRPFHICAGCSAYNAKAEPRCWRCDADLTKDAIEPGASALSNRLEQMDEQRSSQA